MTIGSLTDPKPSRVDQSPKEDSASEKNAVDRRLFLRKSVVAGATITPGAGTLQNLPSAFAESDNGHLTRGDVTILRWLSATEIIETNIWLQYQELAGNQDNEVSTIAVAQPESRHLFCISKETQLLKDY
jgi:hypothetical protein